MSLYQAGWRLANRVRRAFGRAAQPKRCCRKPVNLERMETGRPDASAARCKVCGCRHFGLVLDAGVISVDLKTS